MATCVLIKFKDKEVFTDKKNIKILKEFLEKFDSQTLEVETDSPTLEVEEIAKIFCNPNETFKHYYKVKSTMTKKSYDISSHIESILLEGEVVRIKELHNFFKDHHISVSTIYRHLSNVKEKLAKEGREIKKIQKGAYKLLNIA